MCLINLLWTLFVYKSTIFGLNFFPDTMPNVQYKKSVIVVLSFIEIGQINVKIKWWYPSRENTLQSRDTLPSDCHSSEHPSEVAAGPNQMLFICM